jgi:HK97 family phage portal protein
MGKRIAGFWGRVDDWDRRIARVLAPQPLEQREGWYALPGGFGYAVSSGAIPGGEVDRALSNAASWACIDVLADALSRTPFDAIRGLTPADRRPVDPPPQILANPSGITTPDVWKSQLAWSLLTDGNAFGSVVAMGRNGYPTQIELLDPSTVTERTVVNGVKVVKVDHVAHRCYPDGDIWHVPGRMVVPGSPFGLSPLRYAAKVTSSSLQAEDFSYQFFASGGHPTQVVYSTKELNQEQAQQIKDAIRRVSSPGNRETLVLGAANKMEQVQLDPNETQFIDLMRFNVEQTCRFWRVPPSMVYASVSGQNVTYANVNDADLSYLKNSLDGYLVRYEEALSALLPRPQYVRANRNAVLRSDISTRYTTYQIGIRNGWINRDQIRGWEDMVPIEDGTGGEYVWPPVGQGAGMDSKPPSTGGTITDDAPKGDTPTVNEAPAAAPAAPTK